MLLERSTSDRLLRWWWLPLLPLLLVAGWYGQRLIQPPLAPQLPLDPSCLLDQSPCTLTLPTAGAVTVTLQPQPIHPLQPLQLVVRGEGVTLQQANGVVSGVTMDMGQQWANLTAQPDGSWQAPLMLPVCVSDRMGWELLLTIESDQGRWSLPFRFWSSN